MDQTTSLHCIFIVSNDESLIDLFQTHCLKSLTLYTFSTLQEGLDNIELRPSAVFIDENESTNTFEDKVKTFLAFDSNISLIFCYENVLLEDVGFLGKYFFDIFQKTESAVVQLKFLFKKIEQEIISQRQNSKKIIDQSIPNSPSLREKGNDLLLLAIKFLDEFTTQNNLPKKEISKKAKKKLLTYTFPDDKNELKSIIERAALMCNNNKITERDIEFHGNATTPNFLDKEMTFEEYRSRIIHHFLGKYDNDIILVSNKLDLGKSTIYRMLKSEKEKGKRKSSWFNVF